MTYITLKKSATIFFTITLACAALMSTPAHATTNSSGDTTVTNSSSVSNTYGLYTDEKPTKSYKLKNGERKSFQASAYGGVMFTNYLYTGKTRYSITVHNEGSSRLDVSVYDKYDKHIYTASVFEGQIYGFTVQGFKTSDEIYIQFTPRAYVPYRFSGHIQ